MKESQEAFEKWVKAQKLGYAENLEKYPHGEYKDDRPFCAFEIWDFFWPQIRTEVENLK